jgi:hypothetical protein
MRTASNINKSRNSAVEHTQMGLLRFCTAESNSLRMVEGEKCGARNAEPST